MTGAAALLPATGCDFFSNPGQNPASELRVVDGDGQTAPAGSELPQRIVVRAVDAEGRAIAGLGVSFVVAAGGGSVAEPVAVTDDSGVVSTSWSLGTRAGDDQRLEARAGEGEEAAVATFTATAVAGEPAQLIKTAGDGQVAAPGEQLPDQLVVRLADRFDNPIAGATIAWSASSGNVSPGQSQTDGAGAARTNWRLGTVAGSYTATASYSGVAPATFSAGTSLGGVTLTKTAGDGQSAPAGSELPIELVVTLRGPSNQPIEGVTVRWAAAAGTVVPAESPTSAAGEARARWTMPATTGPQTLTVDAGGQAGVTFTATSLAGAPATVTIVAGNAQAGDVGAALAEQPAVLVGDAAGNPVSGATVTWTVTAGGGTAAPVPSTTGADGIARVTWTLGLKADGSHTMVAAAGTAGVEFTATPRVPASLVLFKTGGDGQTRPGGSALPDSLEVTARLADGRAVEGVRVTWSASHGGAVTARGERTAPDGKLRARWTLGTTAGTQTAVARWLDSQGAPRDSVTFTATAQAGSASVVTVLSGNGQTGDVGAALPDSLAAVVRDGAGNPVAGATVSWAVTAGGGTVSPVTRVTDASGVARAAWTLGLKADVTHGATATVGFSAALFSATPRVPANLGFVKTGGDAQNGTAGSALPDSLEVQTRLADGRPVEGVRITWSASDGGGVVPRGERSAPDGRMRARWTLGSAAGTQRVVARWLNAQNAPVDSVVFTAAAAAPSGAPR